MLQNLHVKNLALIDEVEITFDEHLNILTGETGAGKSVLIGSIESALGKKISKDMIRPGAKEAVIELLFWIEDQKLIKEIEALDLEVEDGQIFIKRVINEKRSINKINDSTVTLNTLREVSRRLFDLHGQQEHQVLLKEKNHLSMMDHFLPENARYSLEQCKNLAGEYHEISTKIKEISIDDQQRLREMDFLKHEISEIENANLVKGEDEELETVYQKIVHSRDIITSCQAAHMLTGYEEETSIGNQLSESIRRMQEISHLDPQISEFYEQLLSVEDLLNGFHQELTTYMENMEFDEQTYQEVEERLNVINSLKDKYGPSIEDVTAYGQKAEKRYNMLCDAEHEIDQKERDIENLCFKLLLKQQPVAKDLRQVSAALRMISDMERIGDQASDIVENARYIQDNTYESNLHIRDMAEATMKMVTDSIDSFVKRDLELARKTMKEDDVVDELFNKVKTELIGLIGEDSSKGEMCLDLLMIAKYFERIGDHATNIAEWVEYSITGVHIED